MAETQSSNVDERDSRQRSTQHESYPQHEQTIQGNETDTLPPSISLLNDARLEGRGNAPARAAALGRAQQTHGNRAVQRFVSARTTVQRFSLGGAIPGIMSGLEGIQRGAGIGAPFMPGMGGGGGGGLGGMLGGGNLGGLLGGGGLGGLLGDAGIGQPFMPGMGDGGLGGMLGGIGSGIGGILSGLGGMLGDAGIGQPFMPGGDIDPGFYKPGGEGGGELIDPGFYGGAGGWGTGGSDIDPGFSMGGGGTPEYEAGAGNVW